MVATEVNVPNLQHDNSNYRACACTYIAISAKSEFCAIDISSNDEGEACPVCVVVTRCEIRQKKGTTLTIRCR